MLPPELDTSKLARGRAPVVTDSILRTHEGPGILELIFVLPRGGGVGPCQSAQSGSDLLSLPSIHPSIQAGRQARVEDSKRLRWLAAFVTDSATRIYFQ